VVGLHHLAVLQFQPVVFVLIFSSQSKERLSRCHHELVSLSFLALQHRVQCLAAFTSCSVLTFPFTCPGTHVQWSLEYVDSNANKMH